MCNHWGWSLWHQLLAVVEQTPQSWLTTGHRWPQEPGQSRRFLEGSPLDYLIVCRWYCFSLWMILLSPLGHRWTILHLFHWLICIFFYSRNSFTSASSAPFAATSDGLGSWQYPECVSDHHLYLKFFCQRLRHYQVFSRGLSYRRRPASFHLEW